MTVPAVDPFYVVWFAACDWHVPNKIFTGVRWDDADLGCDECMDVRVDAWERSRL